VNSEKANRPVFDASAVLALAEVEPGSDRLRDVQSAVVCAVNAAEAVAKLVSRGVPLSVAQAAYDALHLETVPFESIMVSLSARFVQKNLSLGDRCFLATALSYGPGWTSDRNLGARFATDVPLNFFR